MSDYRLLLYTIVKTVKRCFELPSSPAHVTLSVYKEDKPMARHLFYLVARDQAPFASSAVEK